MDGREGSKDLCCMFGLLTWCHWLSSVGGVLELMVSVSHPVFTAEQYQQHQEQLVLMQKQQLEQSQQQQQPLLPPAPPQQPQQHQTPPPPQKLLLQQQPTTNTQVSAARGPASSKSQCE